MIALKKIWYDYRRNGSYRYGDRAMRVVLHRKDDSPSIWRMAIAIGI
jgi:hypothetical protein